MLPKICKVVNMAKKLKVGEFANRKIVCFATKTRIGVVTKNRKSEMLPKTKKTQAWLNKNTKIKGVANKCENRRCCKQSAKP